MSWVPRVPGDVVCVVRENYFFLLSLCCSHLIHVSSWNVFRCTANQGAIIRKYHLHMCRQCFRERAEDIGFVKVSTITIIVPFSSLDTNRILFSLSYLSFAVQLN